jgi:hypothetical protein
MFIGEVAYLSADATPFLFGGFGAVLHVMVEQEAPVALTVGLGDSRRPNCNRCAKHGKAPGLVDLLDLFPSRIYEDERAVRFFEGGVSERFA